MYSVLFSLIFLSQTQRESLDPIHRWLPSGKRRRSMATGGGNRPRAEYLRFRSCFWWWPTPVDSERSNLRRLVYRRSRNCWYPTNSCSSVSRRPQYRVRLGQERSPAETGLLGEGVLVRTGIGAAKVLADAHRVQPERGECSARRPRPSNVTTTSFDRELSPYPESWGHTRSLAHFITTTSGFTFSV